MESIVVNNLMKIEGYTPYCGSNAPRPPVGNGCSNPRTIFIKDQFQCPRCGWRSKYSPDFIQKYKEKWDMK
jgi:hypothetical protein